MEGIYPPKHLQVLEEVHAPLSEQSFGHSPKMGTMQQTTRVNMIIIGCPISHFLQSHFSRGIESRCSQFCDTAISFVHKCSDDGTMLFSMVTPKQLHIL